jgi:hypothetical protein
MVIMDNYGNLFLRKRIIYENISFKLWQQFY